ncbi:hypothetical protein [Phormidium sp. CCY1219]|uniref:hypothetical protein n=1 Tax=Phormidium sp. CCY1219 TaxID=2886104 RepID=UPI002D1F05D9|nr:hypothetical protein [Phormidium sp. CCY1219]MEB3829465.1 hypothetical protein [Phormidium sp. CCY1219]
MWETPSASTAARILSGPSISSADRFNFLAGVSGEGEGVAEAIAIRVASLCPRMVHFRNHRGIHHSRHSAHSELRSILPGDAGDKADRRRAIAPSGYPSFE